MFLNMTCRDTRDGSTRRAFSLNNVQQLAVNAGRWIVQDQLGKFKAGACSMVTSSAGAVPPITSLVPMIRVSDVERSAVFYRLLGFEVGNRVPRTGKPSWAWLYQPRAENWKRGANLMVVAGERPPAPDAYQVLYYHYATNLPATRDQLMAAGVKVSEITYPEYLPAGEFSTEDPDGHRLMIAQSDEDTP
jgi:catechol 2,3-dioxygenase-like lactoylglutathione lyase family enzyme